MHVYDIYDVFVVQVDMDAPVTPSSGVFLPQTQPSLTKAVTEMVTKGAQVFPVEASILHNKIHRSTLKYNSAS